MNSNVLQLIKQGESEQMEFKGARCSLDVLAREVCGLLNQQGGYVLWGVNDDGQPVGISRAEEKAEALSKLLMSSMNPKPFLSVSVQIIGDSEIVVVRIPFGYDKPYSLNRKIWVRIGSKTLRAGEEHSAAIVEQSTIEQERWERDSMPGFSMSDCDESELNATRAEIEQSGRFGANAPSDFLQMLEQLYLCRSGRLTNAAAVLFASRPRMWSPHIYARVVSYAGDKVASVANDVMIEAPAVRLFQEIVSVIQQRTGFSSRFKRDRIEREDAPAYPLYCLREALVNAITHRAYDALGGCVRVEIYSNRLVISNPGHLPEGWTTGNLRKEHKSVPFNPDIAQIFYLRGYMEQLGVGTQRMIEESKRLGAKPPTWSAQAGMVSVTLFKAPEPAGEMELVGRQAEVFQLLKGKSEFKVSDYAAAAGVSDRQARRDVVELEEKGIIERIGKGRATVYRKRRDGST